MTLRKFLASIAGAAALAFPGAALPQFDPVGDDTDIFLANPLLEATRPNVLFMIDNTANWNTPFDVEKSALVNTMNGLVTDAFNVGMAMFVETGGDNDTVDGAYIRFGIRQMTPTNKARFVSMVNALDKLGDKGNNATYSLAMDELFRYYAGMASKSTFGKAKRDYSGNIDYNPLAADLEGWPLADKTSETFVSPIVSGCQKNFIIFISNGTANDNSSSLDQARTYLQAAMAPNPLTTIPLAPKPTGEEGLWADEYAKHMATADCAPHVDGVQNVITYTIDVLPGVAGSPGHTALLQSMAENGKGRYFAVNNTDNSTELENALRQIFQEVQAVNSVFASVALPVSVNVRGTNLNQVYIGQFRPDNRRGPRWFGNLKMYKIGQDSSGNAFLVDSLGNRAENAATGFVSPNAESFWTASSTFWSHRPADENGAGGSSDLPDGDLVEKGGAAQRLRARHATDQAQRQVYTCVGTSGFCAGGSLLSASPFAVANADVTAADLGVYPKKPVESITGADASGTPTATATVTAHGWSSGDIVRIAGASPNLYNQTATITVLDANRFTYVLPSLPPANVASVITPDAPTPLPHGLASGDLVDVDSNQPEYDVTDASVTRKNDFAFEYPMSSGTTTASTTHIVFGKKLVTSLSGVGTTAQATVPGHGYGSGPVLNVSIRGANEAAFNVENATVTVVDANSFTYNTLSTITGTANTARVSTAPNPHGFSTGNTVTVAGSSEPLFNGSFMITKIDNTTFSYTVSGDAVASSNAGTVASIGISQITHPTTGPAGDRDVATVMTSVAHGFQDGQSVVISNTGGVPPAGYDGTYTISNASSGATFQISNGNIDGSPTPKVTAGMLAGRSVTQIQPVVKASGTIRSVKAVSVSSLSSKANATGVITAGRPADASGSTAERDALILWVRGRDNAENEKSNVAAPDVRPSAHGDVLHSRPAVVNYGRDASENDVYIYYGTNDGGLRAVKGGTAAVAVDKHPDDSLVQPGDERWSFIPRELLSKLERLKTRTPEISSDNPRDYLVDGAISAYTKDANEDGKLVAADGDKVFLFLAMRRGGDFVYALDASDPGTPKFMWRKQAGDTGYDEMGQTWSELEMTRIRANTRPSETTSANPDNVVLVMGAGYDPAVEDFNPCLIDQHDATSIRKIPVGDGNVTYTSSGTCTVSGATGPSTTVLRSKGRGILVVDALDGHVIWQAGPNPTGATHNVTVSEMTYAIPSDVRVADLNGDGLGDAVFVGDTGGNVWRVDIADADPANWKVRKLATLASSGSTDITNKRKFLFAPEVAIAEDSLGLYLAVLLGSGDREHPFDGIIADSFYMLKDRGETETRGSGGGTRSWTEGGSTLSDGMLGGAVAGGVIRSSDLMDVTNAPGSTESGWRLPMRTGEKIVSSALVVGGAAIFSTNQPTVLAGSAIDACASNLGVARIYTVGAADGSAVSDLDNSGGVTLADRSAIRAGGGYVPSPVFAAIQIGSTTVQTIPTSSQGVCVGAACGDTTISGGGTPPTATTGIVCTGTSCWSVGTIDVGSRRRAYWYKDID